MKSIELFAGIGGISLAAEWAGIETVAFCEIDEFAGKVLKKNWPNVPLFTDIKELNREVLEERGVIERGGTVELISGGFPCQPYSIAGKRKGKEDDRDLWPEMFRVIRELKPTWVVGENVANFIGMELERTVSDLESEGYEVQSFIIPACGVNAKHERYRTFIVANSYGIRSNAEKERRGDGEREKKVQKRGNTQFGFANNYSDVICNTYSESECKTNKEFIPVGSKRESRESITRQYRGETSRTYWQTNKPPICGVVDGVPRGLDKGRLKALGNAVVPQQIYPIFEAIAEIERTKQNDS